MLPSPEVAAWSPVLLAVLFSGFYWAIRRDVRVIGSKIEALEQHFSIPANLAWEGDLTQTYTRTLAIHWSLWSILIVANVLIAVILR
ncbi:MAG: hypothetical protein R3E68_19855 [Burkholderiaceae bacterium]